MTEPTVDREETNKMLILGFDAGCGTCSEIAARVAERVGDKLAVRDLNDPKLTNWREQALGKDASWAPTLFEVDGDEVRAWTGRKMALPLSRKLGLGATWQLMQALGEAESSPKLEDLPVIDKLPTRVAETVGGLSRGQFLKGVGGATVAMSVLSGAGSLAPSALAATKKHPYDIVKSRKITGAELRSTARRIGMSADVRNLVGNGLSTPAKVSAARPAAWMHLLRNGTAQRVVVYRISDERAVSHLEFTKPPKNVAPTQALKFRFDRESKVTTIVKASEGGFLWRRASNSQSAQMTTSSARSAPLEECPPAGSKPPGTCWAKARKCCEWRSSSNDCSFGVGFASISCGSCGRAVYTVTIGTGGPVESGLACAGCGLSGIYAFTRCCKTYSEVWIQTYGC